MYLRMEKGTFELEVLILNLDLLKNIDLKLIYIHIKPFFDFDF